MTRAVALARRKALPVVDSAIALLILADVAIVVALMCAGRLG